MEDCGRSSPIRTMPLTSMLRLALHSTSLLYAYRAFGRGARLIMSVSSHSSIKNGVLMIKLKTRNVTLLTDDEVSLVSGGTDTDTRGGFTDNSCFECFFSMGMCIESHNVCSGPTYGDCNSLHCPSEWDCPTDTNVHCDTTDTCETVCS